jgi:outer membrane receptor for ferrienterochelin and colicins
MRERLTQIVVGCLASAVITAPPAAAQSSPDPQPPQTLEELMQLEVASVYAAAKRDQRVADAPASVTVLTAEDITTFGWRTFAELLNAVRGFYVTYDRNYSYLGVRGFGRPTDFNNRVLLLVDGHRLNDNVYDGAWLGTEFPLSIDVIERVELIRGPGSVLYGANAFFAVINVVTRRGGTGTTAAVEFASRGVLRTTATLGRAPGANQEVLLSFSHDRAAGESSLYYPEYADSASQGFSIGNDADRATRVFANIRLGMTNLQAGFSQRTKDVPTGSWGTTFNDPRNRTQDARAWFDVSRTFAFGHTELQVRGGLDHFSYDGTLAYEDDTLRDFSAGTWLSGEVMAARRLGRHRFLVGTEYRQHLTQDQWSYYEAFPSEFVADVPASSWQGALYAHDEVAVHPKLTAILGASYDYWSLTAQGSSVTPRLGAVYQPQPDTSVKVLYGQAFRNPNVYELFYADATSIANPDLQPERLHNTEIVIEQLVQRRLRLTASVFHTHIRRLISQSEGTALGVQHRNGGEVRSIGSGLETEIRLTGGALMRSAYAWQRAIDEETSEWLSNSPRHLVVMAGAVPWVRRRVMTAAEALYTSSRLSARGRRLGGYWVINTNMVFGSLSSRLRISAGVDNVLGAAVEHPVGLEFVQDAITQDTRTFSLKAIMRF